MFSYIIFMSTCFALKITACVEQPSLELVHVIFRHGSRSPDKFEVYPNDPYTERDFYPYGYGQLTNIGKRRAFQLGKLLRKRYEHFLGDVYIPSMVSTKTTEFVRTQMSALLVLAGLFPPTNVQQWDGNYNWMPIPYSYEKYAQDFELRKPHFYCPALNDEINMVLQSQSVLDFVKELQEDFSYITQHSGRKVTKLKDAFFFFQTLHSEEKMNLTLPEWTRAVYPTKLHYIAAELLHYENLTPLSRRLYGGRMLKKVIDQILAKTNSVLEPEERKLFLYSAHEYNVVSILSVLNLFDKKFPEYSSAVMIELYKDSDLNSYSVKVVYARDVYKEPEELVIPGCTEHCPLPQLLEILDQYFPKNYTAECQSLIALD